MALPSFPDVHVSGPVMHYIRTKNFGGDIWFLGTAEITPQIMARRYRQNVMNDLAGKTLPFQKTNDGEAATVSVLLTRFSKYAEEQLLQSGQAAGIHNGSGQETRWGRGAPVFGGETFELWQVYDNFFNPEGASIGLEIGWYWPQVDLIDHNRVKLGTQGEGLLMVFDCQPKWIPQSSPSQINAADNERGWKLYSQNEADFPAEVRLPQ